MTRLATGLGWLSLLAVLVMVTCATFYGAGR
jgi:hypothetical protein